MLWGWWTERSKSPASPVPHPPYLTSVAIEPPGSLIEQAYSLANEVCNAILVVSIYLYEETDSDSGQSFKLGTKYRENASTSLV